LLLVVPVVVLHIRALVLAVAAQVDLELALDLL
jgi:hypothetical protein